MRYLLPVAQAARLSGVPARTVYRWAAAGLVTTVRRGPRGTLVDLDEVCDRAEARDGALTEGDHGA